MSKHPAGTTEIWKKQQIPRPTEAPSFMSSWFTKYRPLLFYRTFIFVVLLLFVIQEPTGYSRMVQLSAGAAGTVWQALPL